MRPLFASAGASRSGWGPAGPGFRARRPGPCSRRPSASPSHWPSCSPSPWARWMAAACAPPQRSARAADRWPRAWRFRTGDYAPAASVCPDSTTPRSTGSPPAGSGRTIHVPPRDDHPGGGRRGAEGDLVLVSPGIYQESVTIGTDGIMIRGVDRNTHHPRRRSSQLRQRLHRAGGDGVVSREHDRAPLHRQRLLLERCHGLSRQLSRPRTTTATTASTRSTRSTASSTTPTPRAVPTPASTSASASPATRSSPTCISEWNGLGYSGTNAGGNLVIKNSDLDDATRPASSRTRSISEGLPPRARRDDHPQLGLRQQQRRCAGLRDASAPCSAWASACRLATTTTSPHNNVDDQAALWYPRQRHHIDGNFWLASGNVVEHNTDPATPASPTWRWPRRPAPDNCFSDNKATTTLPPLLEVTHACGTPLPLNGGGDFGITELRAGALCERLGSLTRASATIGPVPAPAPQPTMPGVDGPTGPIFTAASHPDSSQGALPAAVGPGGPPCCAARLHRLFDCPDCCSRSTATCCSSRSMPLADVAFCGAGASRRPGVGPAPRSGRAGRGRADPRPDPVLFRRRLEAESALPAGPGGGRAVLCLVITAILMVIANFTL